MMTCIFACHNAKLIIPESLLAPVPGSPLGVTAFVNVTVIPLDTERILPNQTVLVHAGRITSMGSATEVRIPAGAQHIDGTGRFLMPGLADMHIHLFTPLHFPNRPNALISGLTVTTNENIEQQLFRVLARGVTTVRNMDWYSISFANAPLDSTTLLQLRARSMAGDNWMPRMYTAGRWMKASELTLPWQSWSIKPSDVASRVMAYKAAGYDFIKPYFETAEIFDSVVAVARREGISLGGHVPPDVPLSRALHGMKSIEHLTGYLEKDGNTIDVRVLAAETAKARVWNCPTQAHMIAHQLGDAPRRRQLVKALQDSGAGLLLGTDSPLEGPWIYGELEAFVASGLTPYQALLTGTRNVAEFLGTTHETGTVAIGKRADLVLLNANPLVRVGNTAHVAGVMIGGRWLSRSEIDRQLQRFKSERQ